MFKRMQNKYLKVTRENETLIKNIYPCLYMNENNKSRLTTPLLAKRSRANKPFSASSIHVALKLWDTLLSQDFE